jgi:hypothetical protein
MEPGTLRCRDRLLGGEGTGPISSSLEVIESKMFDIELQVWQTEGAWWVESPSVENGPPGVGWRTRCNVLHNGSYTRGREQCATGLTSGDPADVSQVVDRMKPGEPCADPIVADFRC